MTTANPKLSICMPMYNKAAAVARCLGTVLANNTDGMEVLVFDNGSTDGSSDIVRDLAARDTRIRYVRLDHTIMVQESWRMAMLHAKGDILKVQSADDELHPEFLTHMLPPLQQSPQVDFALCAEQIIFHNVTNIDTAGLEKFWASINANCQQILAMPDLRQRARQIATSAAAYNFLGNIYKVLFRRTCLPLDRWKTITPAYPMPTSYPDWDFLLRLLLNHRGIYIDRPLSAYDVTPDAPLVRLRTNPAMGVADNHQLLLQVLTVLADPTLHNLRAAMSQQEIQQLANEAVQRLGKAINSTLSMGQPAAQRPV
jgi:glycosyltransferase involved in cell wall biosynthesis